MNLNAKNSIAHGALTNSKRPECFVEGVYPTHIDYGRDCYVYADKMRYVDYICGLGTNLIGYANPLINKAIEAQLKKGSLFSLGSTLEVEYAEYIKTTFPFIDRLRILKTGSEAASAAIRIARAYTKKSLILSDGYHGFHDEFISLTPPANGVNPAVNFYIDKLDYAHIPHDAAAVIIEPVITDFSEERIECLRKLRQFCTDSGTVLIFDEIITGLRFPGLCVSKWCGVYPDIILLGKALGGGLPIAVVGGKASIMETDYFVSSTFAGDTIAITASLTLLRALNSQEINFANIWDEAKRFTDSFNGLNPDLVRIVGYPTRGVFKCKDELTKALFFQESVKAGLLFGSSFFWCEPHSRESFNTLSLVKAILDKIAKGQVHLEGKMPITPFAQKQRE